MTSSCSSLKPLTTSSEEFISLLSLRPSAVQCLAAGSFDSSRTIKGRLTSSCISLEPVITLFREFISLLSLRLSAGYCLAARSLDSSRTIKGRSPSSFISLEPVTTSSREFISLFSLRPSAPSIKLGLRTHLERKGLSVGKSLNLPENNFR